MHKDFDLREQKLQQALDVLENGNTKRALVEVNKYLKKKPKSQYANALKSLILLRSSKFADATEVMEALIKEMPTERGTLNIMSTFYKESNQEYKMLSYLTTATEKFPTEQDLLVSLFFMHVRSGNFNSQQAVARKLLQNNATDGLFRFWMALSTMMQGENDEALAERMFLPLTERILKNAISDGNFNLHTDIQFLLSILKRQKKYSDALDILNNEELLEKINTSDYKHDYSHEILELQSSLNDWSGIVKTASDILQRDPDNWSAWKILLQHTFQNEGDNVIQHTAIRLEKLFLLIEHFLKRFPKSRGTLIAQMDFSANLVKRGITHPNSDESFCMGLIKNFLEIFGGKPICALDIAYVIPILIKDKEKRFSFLRNHLNHLHEKADSLSANDKEGTHLKVCAYRVARTNGLPLRLTNIISDYQLRATALKSTTNGTPEELELPHPKDLCPPDDLLLIAVSELLDPVTKHPNREHALGRLLLSVHWLAEVGLRHSPANHFMRLLLASILGPIGGLSCVGRQLCELKMMDIKQMLYVSLGHLAIAPGPLLAIWGAQDSQTLTENGGLSETKVSLVDFYQIVINKIGSMQQEAEDWLVGAYRQKTFSRVREFTQFAGRLKHADGRLLARVELIYYRMLVLSNSFDEALEKMGFESREIASVQERLDKITDCRDFGVVPEFSHREPMPDNQMKTFAHLCLWANLRLETANLYSICSKLIMRAVSCIDQLDTGEVVPELQQDLRTLVDTINEKVNSINSRCVDQECIVPFESSAFAYPDLLLTPEEVFTSPPPLTKTTLASFYFTGPFKHTLVAGVELLTHLAELLHKDPDQKPDMDGSLVKDAISEPILHFIDTVDVPGPLVIPTPPCNDAALSASLNPSAVLIGLGVAIETLSLAVLFVSAVVAMLRPRRLAYQSSSIKPRKNKKKKQPTPLNTEARSRRPVTEYLDKVATLLCDVTVPRLKKAATQLLMLAVKWAEWSAISGPSALFATALEAANATLEKPSEENSSFPWWPNSKADCRPNVYREMADNLVIGFGQLKSLCEQKLVALNATLEEVRCFTLSVTGREE